MPATTPATLAALQAVQSLILAKSGTTFAALSAGDSARFGVARAVFVGAPKEFKDGLLPQCHVIPTTQHLAMQGAGGRYSDAIGVTLRVLVDFTDWWAAEQQILGIRDLLIPILAVHLLSGVAAGGALAALSLIPTETRGSFATITIGAVTYRAWEIGLILTQIVVPAGGLVG